MDKPQITISLDKHLHDFLHHEYNTDENGAFLLTKRSDICIYIDSMWCVSDLPVKPNVKENAVTFILPLSDINHRILREHFIYVPSWKELQIQQFIESEFRRRVRDFFCIGYQKGYKQKRIIEAFLASYGMKYNAINFDQIKKFDYRNRENFLKEVYTEIQNAMV